MAFTGVAQSEMTALANQTANRAIGTAYQNTSPIEILCLVNFIANATNTTFSVQIGASNAAFTANGSSGAAAGTYTAILGQQSASNWVNTQYHVPPGWWHQVNANLVCSNLVWWESTN
jgi:hypothetical protein